MKSRLPPLGSLRAFDAVARLRSFKLAAEEIGVSPTAISHQIRLLEDLLGERVLERSPRGVAPTAAGETLLAATRQAFPLLQAAVDRVRERGRSSPLTLSSTTAFITYWLVPRLPELRIRLPDIDLRLHADDDIVDLYGQGIDIAVRYGRRPDDGLRPRLLCEDEFIAAASPALRIGDLEDLRRAALIHVDGRRIPRPAPDWAAWRDRFGPDALAIARGPRFTDETHAIQAAVAGQGVVIASRLLLRQALQSGLLVSPFPHSLPGASYYFIENPAARQGASVARFRNWLLEQMRAPLTPAAGP